MVEESTASITEMISSLDSVNTVTLKKKDSINSLVKVVGNGSSTLNEMAEGFKTDAVSKIEGISEMTIGSEQIVRGQLELKDISEKVNRGILEISSGSEEIVIAADEIVKHSLDLDSVVNNLKEETDKFTV